MAAQRKKDDYVYRVEVDYKAAGVHSGHGTTSTEIYERKAGAMSKIRAALQMNVHPKFITVRRTLADWKVDPEFEGLCPACKEPYELENEDCPQNTKIDKENARREHTRNTKPQYYEKMATMQPLVRPHPQAFVISETPELRPPFEPFQREFDGEPDP